MTGVTKEELDGLLNNPELPAETKQLIKIKIKDSIDLIPKLESDIKALNEERKEADLKHTLCSNERAELKNNLKLETDENERLTNNLNMMTELKHKAIKDLELEVNNHNELKQKNKMVTEAHSELKQKYNELFDRFQVVNEKAGKFDQIKKNFSLPPNYPK